MKERRIGEFCISDQLLEQDEKLAQTILATTIVIRAEHNYAKCAIDYVAISENFREYRPGEMMRQYSLDFTRDGLTLGFEWVDRAGIISIPPELVEQADA